MDSNLGEKDTYVFVAVRMKSSRLPLKALADIHGKPLIQRLVDRQLETMPLDRIVLCTSEHPQDDAIQHFASENKINCFRGDELDVMGRFLSAAQFYSAKTIVRVTGDNPLTDPYMLTEMLKQHFAASAEYTYSEDLPIGTRPEIIDVEALRRVHEQLSNSDYSEYMTFMLKRPDKLINLKAKVHNKSLIRPELSVTVDNQNDISLVRQIFRHFGDNLPCLEDIIYWLDSNPELKIEVPSNEDISTLLSEIDCSYNSDAKN
jgi:spore coat polysaccharide biosynthesis protein SpsF